MVPDRQKVWTDRMDGGRDDAKTISLRLRRGINSRLHLRGLALFVNFPVGVGFSLAAGVDNRSSVDTYD